MNFKPYFTFTASQRSGLLSLLLVIAVLQIALFSIRDLTEDQSKAKQRWLALQPEIDVLKKQKRDFVPKTYPFNPNFISDFKGYKLGMSTAEIDRLLEFRKAGKFVNSAAEFQRVTKISDSLLASMSPYFKFPEWVRHKNPKTGKWNKPEVKAVKKVLLDINSATRDDLIAVYGIGPALSERILKQREMLGGFVSMEQMNDIWGLSPEVVDKLRETFKIGVIPPVKKIAINDAPLKTLAQFPYFRYQLAKDIVTYRSMNGAIKDADDLKNIKNFPVEKVSIIAVYLEF